MKQIAVIGNGFDLSCGLESRYSDFFKNRVCLKTTLLVKIPV
jgi:hypothetical protein